MANLSHEAQITQTVSVVFIVFAAIAVALRFYTRGFTKVGYAADDWWVLASIILLIIVGSLLLYGVRADPDGGEFIDRDSPTFDYSAHVIYLQVAFIDAVLYFSIVTAIKLSILVLYRRIFAVASFRLYALIIGFIVVVWWIVGTIATIVSCIPVSRLWIGPSAGGYCFNFNIYWLVIGAVELLIDCIILAMPVRIVLGLQLSLKQKILIAGIFLLGGFVIITGILRLAFGYEPGSQNVNFARAELWSAVHLGTAIVCACLPIFRPLYMRFRTTASSIRNRYSGRRSQGGSTQDSASKGAVEMYPRKSPGKGSGQGSGQGSGRVMGEEVHAESTVWLTGDRESTV